MKLRQPFAFIAIYSWLHWLTGQETVVEDAMYLISLFRFYFVAFLLIFASVSAYKKAIFSNLRKANVYQVII